MKPTGHDGIYDLGNGWHRIRTSCIDASGRLRELDRKRRCSLAEALEFKAAWRAEMKATRSAGTLGEYAAAWLTMRRAYLKPSTVAGYEQILKHHIRPFLGSARLESMTPPMVSLWIVRRLDAGYSARTVTSALLLLRTIVRDAVDEFQLPRDPCRRVRAPQATTGYTEEDPNLVTRDELALVLAAFARVAPQHHALACTLAYTGARWGEATALRGGDVDFDAGVIRIRRSQWKGRVGTPKSGKPRIVPLLSDLAAILRPMAGDPMALLFPRGESYVAASTFRDALRRACKAAGIEKRLTPHGLRRTFNNLVRQLSGDVAREVIGHTSAKMTAHYSHVSVAEKAEVIRRAFGIVSEPHGENPHR